MLSNLIFVTIKRFPLERSIFEKNCFFFVARAAPMEAQNFGFQKKQIQNKN
jgi:hypothetical protein